MRAYGPKQALRYVAFFKSMRAYGPKQALRYVAFWCFNALQADALTYADVC